MPNTKNCITKSQNLSLFAQKEQISNCRLNFLEYIFDTLRIVTRVLVCMHACAAPFNIRGKSKYSRHRFLFSFFMSFFQGNLPLDLKKNLFLYFSLNLFLVFSLKKNQIPPPHLNFPELTSLLVRIRLCFSCKGFATSIVNNLFAVTLGLIPFLSQITKQKKSKELLDKISRRFEYVKYAQQSDNNHWVISNMMLINIFESRSFNN